VRPIELDVISRTLVGAAMAEIIAENGRLEIVVQNAGHIVLGPAEVFTPEQLAELYDISALGAQSVKCAARIGGRRDSS